MVGFFWNIVGIGLATSAYLYVWMHDGLVLARMTLFIVAVVLVGHFFYTYGDMVSYTMSAEASRIIVVAWLTLLSL